MSWDQSERTDDDSHESADTTGRSSPVLFEVELTASDEDDDTSVLELVIPIQSNRKNKSDLIAILHIMFCCFGY